MASGKPAANRERDKFYLPSGLRVLKIRAEFRCYNRTKHHLTLLLKTLLYTAMLLFIIPVLPSNNRICQPCVCREDQPHIQHKWAIACTVYYPTSFAVDERGKLLERGLDRVQYYVRQGKKQATKETLAYGV